MDSNASSRHRKVNFSLVPNELVERAARAMFDADDAHEAYRGADIGTWYRCMARAALEAVLSEGGEVVKSNHLGGVDFVFDQERSYLVFGPLDIPLDEEKPNGKD